MIAKLLSRKFVLAVLGALLIVLNKKLGLGLTEDDIRNIVVILTGWIVGESAIDASRVWGLLGKPPTVPTP